MLRMRRAIADPSRHTPQHPRRHAAGSRHFPRWSDHREIHGHQGPGHDHRFLQSAADRLCAGGRAAGAVPVCRPRVARRARHRHVGRRALPVFAGCGHAGRHRAGTGARGRRQPRALDRGPGRTAGLCGPGGTGLVDHPVRATACALAVGARAAAGVHRILAGRLGAARHGGCAGRGDERHRSHRAGRDDRPPDRTAAGARPCPCAPDGRRLPGAAGAVRQRPAGGIDRNVRAQSDLGEPGSLDLVPAQLLHADAASVPPNPCGAARSSTR